ncbi:Endonuclease, Uma2 family (restriction endonuclease fold) [Granulicella rosea]|uniref:Endonuclease, Uma2 family (Restriction endonuclease fold) n=2 Tax=Granulicella rosea TaxID=474952 RepID=A0A239ME85_9BACT|nr:Endonuclease, Uma2 family (restriction endonuclease fold) [Granulicella rosea]
MSEYTQGMDLRLVETDLPLRLRFETPLSEEALFRFCEGNDSVWIEREPNGELSVGLLAGARASRVLVAILCQLWDWAEKDGRGQVLSNAGFLLPDGSMRGAQLAWVSNERWQALTEEQRHGFAPLCPEFVVHVLGFAAELAEARARMERWIANGAQFALLFDPGLQQVTTFRSAMQPEIQDEWKSGPGGEVFRGAHRVLSGGWR